MFKTWKDGKESRNRGRGHCAFGNHELGKAEMQRDEAPQIMSDHSIGDATNIFHSSWTRKLSWYHCALEIDASVLGAAHLRFQSSPITPAAIIRRDIEICPVAPSANPHDPYCENMSSLFQHFESAVL